MCPLFLIVQLTYPMDIAGYLVFANDYEYPSN